MKGKMQKRISLMLYKKPGANKRLIQMKKSFDEINAILNSGDKERNKKK